MKFLFCFFETDLTLNDLHLEPLENVNGSDLLVMDPPTYEEALLLATGCLSLSGDNNSLTSPDGSQPSLSQSPPKNLEHFSPTPQMGPSPYPSPGHPASHNSPSGLPTPDPSPVGHCNPSTARVNISWQGMGQMKVSTQPLQHCQPQPSPQVHSKSALISTTIKKKERLEMYGSSCVTGQPANPMTSPRGMQNVHGNWMQQNQPQVPRNMPQQAYDWKAAQAMQHSAMQNFSGDRTATAIAQENPVYATNMQGGKWDNVTVPPLFEDTLPTLDFDGGVGYMKTGQNIGGGHLQHHNWEPPVDILSPPYQEDFHPGFGFQGNPLPATTTQGQTTLGWG